MLARGSEGEEGHQWGMVGKEKRDDDESWRVLGFVFGLFIVGDLETVHEKKKGKQ